MILTVLIPVVLSIPYFDQQVYQENKQCPPKGLDSAQNFDIEKYISQPWYIQYQEPTSYQRSDNLFCVRAQYAFEDEYENQNFVVDALLKFFRWFRYGPGVKTLAVMNYANEGKVNGKTRDGVQQGLLLNIKDSSKLLVGPGTPFVPRWFYGDYFVMYVDEQYQSAIVSGGLPGVYNSTTGLCQTLSNERPFNPINNNGNKQGLWFFTRQKVANVDHLFAKAKELGYETGRMVHVPQQGCRYQ